MFYTTLCDTDIKYTSYQRHLWLLDQYNFFIAFLCRNLSHLSQYINNLDISMLKDV